MERSTGGSGQPQLQGCCTHHQPAAAAAIAATRASRKTVVKKRRTSLLRPWNVPAMIIHPMSHPFHGVAPLPHLGVIRVQGEDAARFLHGQLTQDFALLGAGRGPAGGLLLGQGPHAGQLHRPSSAPPTRSGWCAAVDLLAADPQAPVHVRAACQGQAERRQCRGRAVRPGRGGRRRRRSRLRGRFHRLQAGTWGAALSGRWPAARHVGRGVRCPAARGRRTAGPPRCGNGARCAAASPRSPRPSWKRSCRRC